MPTSRPYHLTWLCNKVIELNPQSVLDIGIGFGSKGMLFREYTDVWRGSMFDKKVRIDGVEIFDKYIGKLQREIYDHIYIGSILELIDTLPDYDLIYMGDVLEHLTRDQGFELIKKLKRKCRDLIIVTPAKVSHQGSVYDNVNETHLSQWYPIDFEGCSVIEINNSMVISWEKPEVYYCEGMKFYGERMMTLYGLKPFSNNPEKDVLFMGLYFEQDYEVYKSITGNKIVFWNGSDVSRLLDKSAYQEILKEYPAKHVCHNEQLQQELLSVGINALVQPLFFADINDYPVSFKSKEQLEVYVNAHPSREDEYGIPWAYQAALRLPEVMFYAYGVEGVNTDNFKYMGMRPEKEVDKLMSEHQVFLRLNRHDGFSQQVIKAGLWGQPIITRQDIPHTIKVDDMLDLVEKIDALKGLVQPQTELREWLLGQNLNSLDWL